MQTNEMIHTALMLAYSGDYQTAVSFLREAVAQDDYKSVAAAFLGDGTIKDALLPAAGAEVQPKPALTQAPEHSQPKVTDDASQQARRASTSRDSVAEELAEDLIDTLEDWEDGDRDDFDDFDDFNVITMSSSKPAKAAKGAKGDTLQVEVLRSLRNLSARNYSLSSDGRVTAFKARFTEKA